MAASTHRETAKVYEFPSGVRTSRSGAHRNGAAHPTPAKVEHAECGSGWYHEAAVEEAEHASTLAIRVRLFTDRI